MQIDLFNSFFNVEFRSSNSDTIGGYLIEKFENFPDKGESITIDHMAIKIRTIRKRKIELIEIFTSEKEI